MDRLKILLLTVAVSVHQVTSQDSTDESPIKISKPKITLNPAHAVLYNTETVTLRCEVPEEPSGLQYDWYKNSADLGEHQPSITARGSGKYECKAKKGASVSDKSDSYTLTLTELPQPQVQSDYTDAFPGETVSLQCVIQDDSKNWNYLWFKDSNKIDRKENPLTLSFQSGHKSSLVQYECQAELQGRKVMTAKSTPHSLKVHGSKPTLILKQDPSGSEVYTGEKVTFTCVIQEQTSQWEYRWKKDATQVRDSTYTISKAALSDDGTYTCQVERKGIKFSEPTKLIVRELPQPKLPIESQWTMLYLTEKVILKCSISEDSNKWGYEWFRNGDPVKDEDISLSGNTLSISSSKVGHSGQYTCRGKHLMRPSVTTNQTQAVQLQINEPPETQIRSDWTEAFHGEKVSLLCVNQDGLQNWTYLWFKGSDKIVSNDKTNINKNTLTLSVESSHNGAYQCQAKLEGRKVTTAKSTPHSLTVHGPQPTLVLEQDPSDSEIYIGEQVKLNCIIKEKTSQWKYLWRKDSAEANRDRIYTISSADVSHDGTYTCQVERKGITFSSKQSKKLTIKERPRPKLSLESQWTMFYPNEKVTLKCSINEDSEKWGYDWFKNGAQLFKYESISFPGNTLVISSAKADHSGQYTCRGKYLKRTSVTTNQTNVVQLHINDTTPDVTITKHEWFDLFYTEERVQLHCNMPGDGWKYHWHKDSNFLTTKPEFTIDSVSHADTGDYHCKAQRGEFSVDSKTLQVRVEACPPASLSLETELSDIMTGDVTLRCNVSDGRQWNYTWYMNGEQLNESSNVLKVTGNEETIKSEFKCKGINTERPLYSALSDGFTANNIIFKRKILLAISGCLVCCIVILIIGCIVLKITRKPEEKEAAPEDLFFSMTDSKNQTVSPMKEYMDNRPTELEECQEKEELITDVHEDGVIKDEATPASETNGLMSFKGN